MPSARSRMSRALGLTVATANLAFVIHGFRYAPSDCGFYFCPLSLVTLIGYDLFFGKADGQTEYSPVKRAFGLIVLSLMLLSLGSTLIFGPKPANLAAAYLLVVFVGYLGGHPLWAQRKLEQNEDPQIAL